MATQPVREWSPITDASGAPRYHVFSKEIQRSTLDNRGYRYIRLPNNLEALLISDPATDKAAAALDVGVGHLNDPDDMPGCAHFCEHLLFMGTDEFPSENEYSEFIATHGGSTNAYTSAYNTNYYFSVSHSSLVPALHRFSAFFKNPRFNESCTAREILAVDSEHKKNLQNDTWRMFQLSKELSRKDHVWRKFGSGNKESLLAVGKVLEKQAAKQLLASQGKQNQFGMELEVPSRSLAPSPTPSQRSGVTLQEDDGGVAGRETRRRLVEWWEKHYCASRMKLVILGRESLDELTDMAVKSFSPVPDRHLPPLPLYDESPFGDEHQGVVAYAKTIMDFKALEIVWTIPWLAPHYQVKPGNFLSHFLGHEGPGSLHAYLRNKGWITYLSAGPSTGAPGFEFFKVTVVLTKEGFENHVEVLRSIYSYLSLFRNASSAELKAAQDEIIKLSAIAFRYKEKASSVSSYASRLAERAGNPWSRDKLLSAMTVTEEWDEPFVRNLLEKKLVPERGRVMIMAREGWEEVQLLDESGENKTPRAWKKEPWYGTEYLLRRIPDDVLKEAPNQIEALALPRRNAFIPDNLDVEKKDIAEPLKRPLKIRETASSTLWYKKDDQFWVPKAQVCLKITSPLSTITPTHNVATRLFVDLVRDELTEYSYDAELAGLSYEVTNQAEGISLVVAGYNDKLNVLLKVVLEKIRNLEVKEDRFAVLKEQVRQEYVNFAMEQPYHSSDYYARYLLAPLAWTPEEKLSELAASNHILQLPVPNQNDVNSALTYYVDVGDIADARIRSVLSLFAHIANEPAFNQLRTVEQLGYTVSSSVWGSTGSIGWRLVIQSERTPAYLENRVDEFLYANLRPMLERMSDDEFDQKRRGLIQKKLEKHKNLSDETNTFWIHIISGYDDFMRRANDAKILETVSRQEVLDLFMRYIHPASRTRSKLSIHMQSQVVPSPKFSLTASNALIATLQSRGLGEAETEFREFSATEPPVSDVKQFWEKHLKAKPGLSQQVTHDLFGTIDTLAKTHPSEADVNDGERLGDDVQYIRDIAHFKAGLGVSKAATPVEIYSDFDARL
ncbi:Insulinase (Peptidase M16) [Tulasnella sp. 403]|nr:Insulinase (Peptidase M16) [Tulasnella sp. 403]